ncbi:MAG: serine/threonine protein kinase, partial [Planctomycetes bacterium]|nr:serine/threonine protein kinase [Planctomycetota bacterium]
MTSDNRLDRLQRALDLFVAWREDPAAPPADDFLALHADLRALLEPMVRPPAAGEDGDELPEAPSIAAGARLGDYALLRQLGEGGMGRVFEAEQVSLHRRVVVKVLNGELTGTPAAIERFRREASSAARLRHPGIVPIFEVGERSGVHFFAMEHVGGTSLDELCRRGDLGAPGSRARCEFAARVVAEVAEALQYAHEHGVVHRDVKPQNVLIADDGSVRLIDFGLASDIARRPGAGGQGRPEVGLIGTPHYMSPEQASGAADGPASDVFSCGVVLYELLSGRRPFDAPSTGAVLQRIVASEPPTMSASSVRVPRGLAVICTTCLGKTPASRYPSAGALAADLRAWLRGEPLQSDPPGAGRRLVGLVRRHPAGAAAAALAVAVAVAAPSFWWFQEWRLQSALARERADARAAADAAVAAVRQLVTVLDDRLARQTELEPGYERQLEAAAALCVERLDDLAVGAPERRKIAGALIDLAEIHIRLGDAGAGRAPLE